MVSFHHDNLKTVATWTLVSSSSAWSLSSVQKRSNFATECSVLQPSCLSEGTIWALRQTQRLPLEQGYLYHDGQLLSFFPFFFFGVALERNMLLASFFDWERKCLGLQRKNINRWASAAILSIKGRLTGWVMSGNHLSERDRLTQALSDLAVWTTHT